MTLGPKIRKAAEASTAEEARPPEYSDDSLADKVAEEYRDDKRYIATMSSWVVWDNTRWRLDDTLHTYDDVRLICRRTAVGCNDPSLAKRISSKTTIAAVEHLARADRRIAARLNQFDADPWMLNTPSGTINLRTGEKHLHSRANFCMKTTAVGPSKMASPRWSMFLTRITGGDTELQRFLARAIGYSLTGSVHEHAFFFCFGSGGNGKSVFLETIAAILGDYSAPAPIEMFTAAKHKGHSTDVAGLKGLRFVTASETEAGRSFDEARLKLLTGGDTVSARRMRADNISFRPEFKLWILGNHKPHILSSDEAMRRRLHLVPFDVTIPPEERDPKLPEKLREEWPAIMQWAIDGCLEAYRCGLQPPIKVRNATDEYLRSEDTIEHFLTEHVTLEASGRASTDELFGRWRVVCTMHNEQPGTLKDFVKALENKNLRRRHGRDGNRWIGIRLLEKPQ